MIAPTIAQSIALAKAQILEDITTGRVPASVRSFIELDDYVDANCYADFCEDDVFDALLEHFGGRDADQSMPKGMRDFLDTVQNKIDFWLAAGRPDTKE